jgi:hypothetical protein
VEKVRKITCLQVGDEWQAVAWGYNLHQRLLHPSFGLGEKMMQTAILVFYHLQEYGNTAQMADPNW